MTSQFLGSIIPCHKSVLNSITVNLIQPTAVQWHSVTSTGEAWALERHSLRSYVGLSHNLAY